MKRRSTWSRSTGLSLIELMISILLGILLILGAGAAYLSAKQAYTETEQVATLRENAEFAEQVISDALQHAGFFGQVPAFVIQRDGGLTAPTAQCAPTATAPAAVYNFRQYIFAVATAAAAVTAVPCIDDAKVDTTLNTEVLVVKRALPRPYIDTPAGPGLPGDGTIDDPPLVDDTTFILTNNISGIAFDGADTPPIPALTSGTDDTYVTAWPYLYEAYYVRDRDPDTEDDVPLLARKVLSWNGAAMAVITEDVVEGVEQLRVRLGYDTNGDGEVDTYNSAASLTATDWDNVVSVEVYMLVRSGVKDYTFTDTKTYNLGGTTTFTPPVAVQNYRRMLVFTSASLRNPKMAVRGQAG